MVGDRIANGSALSVFHCPNVACMFAAVSWVQPSNLVCIAHAPANRAPGKPGRALVVGAPKREDVREPGRSNVEASKLGGHPALIQTTALEMAARAAADGFAFLFQRMNRLANRWLPPARIQHPYPEDRFHASHPR